MKNFYFFSKKKLKFVEIKNFYRKFVFLVLFFSALISAVLFSGYFFINQYLNPEFEVKSLQSENDKLSKSLKNLLSQYEDLNDRLAELSEKNDDLRLAVNLDPVEIDKDEIGIGGSVFKDYSLNSSEDIQNVLSNLSAFVDNIEAQLNFETNNYVEIEKTLELNKKLYDCIPALKPTVEGVYGDRFGMRMHPILKVKKMHNGLDIIVNRGTQVYAPGGGTVDFVGRRSGLGLVVEIDHGFGYRTLYGHLSKALVNKGNKVNRGDLIALSGSSGGLSTGPHLHYEVRHDGIALNPLNFIYDDVSVFDITSDN